MTDTTGSYLIYRHEDVLIIREGEAAPASGSGVWALPRHVLDLYLPDMPRPLMVSIPMVETLATLVATYLEALGRAAEELKDGEATMVADTLARLLAAACGEASLPHAQAIRDAKLDQVRRYIRRYLSSPSLDPQMVAQGLGISPRQLHLLFKPTGETFSQYVRRLRLEECRATLQNPMVSNRSIADIAFSWGFASLPTFYRAFHAAYGMAPGDLREPIARSEAAAFPK